jgi:hypothetical protein
LPSWGPSSYVNARLLLRRTTRIKPLGEEIKEAEADGAQITVDTEAKMDDDLGTLCAMVSRKAAELLPEA